MLTLIDRDEFMTHPQFRRKLEAIGYGVFIPFFFVASGVRYDLPALTESASNIAMVPIFLAALVVVRGGPAVLYRGFVGGRRTVVAALFQATSLPFIVAAAAIGMELGLLDAATGAALIAAGLLSVCSFRWRAWPCCAARTRRPPASPPRPAPPRPGPRSFRAASGRARATTPRRRPDAY